MPTNSTHQLQTEQQQKLFPEIGKSDLKVKVLPPNYLENLKMNVEKVKEILAQPGYKEKLIADVKKYEEEQQVKEELKNSDDPTIIKGLLLHKEHMTPKDKEGMQKTIKFLEDKEKDNLVNLKRLMAINYTKDYIEIGGTKRTREDVKAQPNGTTIYEHNKVTYFKRSEIENQNKILAKQNQEVPTAEQYENTLKSLPGIYKERTDKYVGGNILAILTDMSMLGYCSSDGKLNTNGRGCFWSASARTSGSSRGFRFSEDEGAKLNSYNSDYSFPVRAVSK